MDVLFPLAGFFLILLVFIKRRLFDDFRSAFLASALLWGAIVVLITEGLSLFQAIEKKAIFISWVGFIVFAGCFLIDSSWGSIDVSWITRTFNWKYLRSNGFEIILLVALVGIIILIGLSAWLAPPNNYDSMTYHLSRVVHWIQNRSVAHYPTHIIYQLHQNPWSEYAILQTMLLSGSDRYVNFIQWSSMVGSILGISLITKQLGGDFRAQVFAAVTTVTIPMGVLQGSTTQNDYVLTFWLVCFIYFTLAFRKKPDFTNTSAIGLSLGLAVLTKATAYVYAFPIVVWFGISILKSLRREKLFLLTLVFFIALTINLGHYFQNIALFKNPLGPMADFDTRYTNELVSIPSAISNIVRNTALHLGTPIDSLNAFIEDEILLIHRWIRFSANDPRTTWPGTEFHLIPFLFHEDHAGNLIHLVLILISFVPLVIQPAHMEERILSGLLLFGFLLYCTLLKWMPWNSRLHLPFFVLWSPMIGFMFSRLKAGWIANIYVAFLLIYVSPWVLLNPSRPLFGERNVFTVDRTEQYFALHQKLREPYKAAGDFVTQTSCADIGLIVGENDMEYPFWVLTKESITHDVRLEHVNVTNISQTLAGRIPYLSFFPCALLVTKVNQPETISVRGDIFTRQWTLNPVSVYVKQK